MAGIVNRLRSGELSSVELTEQCLERIERLDAELRVFVTVTADLARERARGADEALARGELLGPLHGLPVALKDNIDTAGIRTTAGAGFLADRVPREDAAVVERLDAAGAVLVGKVQLHELAYGGTTQNPHFGPCRNPWDPERIPGGSSGGSGAAVAAGMCAAALGTDTGGSVRIPAALNGVSGLRPTTGAISNRGLVWLTHSFDTIGPLARTVEDVAALYATLAGYDPEEPTSVPGSQGDPLAELETGIEGMRIGLPASFYFDDADEPVVAAVRAAGDALAGLGASVVEVELPGSAEALEAGTRIIWAEALATHRDRLAAEPESFGRTSAAGCHPARASRAPTTRTPSRPAASGAACSTASSRRSTRSSRRCPEPLRRSRPTARRSRRRGSSPSARTAGRSRASRHWPSRAASRRRACRSECSSPRLRGESRRSSGSAPPTSARPTGTCASRRS